jgi:hypothetical protein
LQQNTTHKLQECQPQPSQKVSRVRPDRGGHLERQVAALEAIAETVKQLVSVQSESKHIAPQTMSYEEAAIVTGISESTLEKMVANGILKKGRHYIKGSASKNDKRAPVLFALNLLELIFEDQLSLEEDELVEVQTQPTTNRITPKCKL